MAAFSDYLENVIINHLLRNQSFTPPTTIYVALFTANTGLEANSPTAEVSTSGTAYSRQAITLAAPSTAGVTSNSSDLNWTTATADWGTLTSVAIVDHATNTTWGTNVNVLMWADLATAKVITTGDTFKFLTGDFDVTVD